MGMLGYHGWDRGEAMPRPSKSITPGSLTDPVPAARSSVWRKHAGPEHSAQYEPDGTLLVDAMTHETVEVIDLTEVEARRAAKARVPVEPAVAQLECVVAYEWVTERSVDGRTYRRSDKLTAQGV